MSFSFKSEVSINQLGSGQDFGTVIHDYNKKCVVGAVFDGHGGNKYIKNIMDTNPYIYLQEINPLFSLKEHLKKIDTNYDSGSTGIVVKLFTDKVVIQYVGDSQAVVYIDGKQVFTTKPHTYNNDIEVKRLREEVFSLGEIPIIDNWKPQLIDDNKITMIQCPYINFFNEKRTNMTQSLGSKNITGFCPSTYTVEFKEKSLCEVVIASDGLWDMIHENEYSDLVQYSASELSKLAEKRWKQEWNYIYNDHHQVTKFPEDNYDDICVIKLSNMIE